jgi:MFS family permease
MGSVIELLRATVADMSSMIEPARLARTLPGTGKPPHRSRPPEWIAAALVLAGAGWGSNQITPMLLVYERRLALSTVTLEALFGVYALGLIPGLLLAGPIADSRGRRTVAIPAVVLSLAASCTLLAGNHTPALLFAGRFLAGVSSGAAFGSATAWLRELSRPPFGAASDHTAARRAAAAMTLGFALGPLVAGLLAQWAPLPTVVPYLPHIALMAVLLPCLRSVPETVTRQDRHERRLAIPELRTPRFRRIVVPLAPWVFTSPAIAVALLPSIVGADRADDGTALVAIVATICAASGVAAQPIARHLDARARGNRSATAGLTVLVAGLALSALTAETRATWLLLPCAAVLGAAYGICLVAGLVEIQRLAGPRNLARATAIYYALTYLGFAAPYVLALSAHLVSYPILLAVTAGLAATTAVATRHGDRPPASSLTRAARAAQARGSSQQVINDSQQPARIGPLDWSHADEPG